MSVGNTVLVKCWWISGWSKFYLVIYVMCAIIGNDSSVQTACRWIELVHCSWLLVCSLRRCPRIAIVCWNVVLTRHVTSTRAVHARVKMNRLPMHFTARPVQIFDSVPPDVSPRNRPFLQTPSMIRRSLQRTWQPLQVGQRQSLRFRTHDRETFYCLCVSFNTRKAHSTLMYKAEISSMARGKSKMCQVFRMVR